MSFRRLRVRGCDRRRRRVRWSGRWCFLRLHPQFVAQDGAEFGRRDTLRIKQTVADFLVNVLKRWLPGGGLTLCGNFSLISLPNYAVSYTHLRAHETRHDLVCRLLLEKKK